MTSPLIATLTGCPVSAASYSTSQSCMTVRFTSDNSVVFNGFTAHYSAEPGRVMCYVMNSTTTPVGRPSLGALGNVRQPKL